MLARDRSGTEKLIVFLGHVVAVFVAGSEVSPYVVAQARLPIGKHDHATAIALHIGLGIELVIHEDLPAVGVATIHLPAVPVMNQRAVYIANVEFKMLHRPTLPLLAAFAVLRVKRPFRIRVCNSSDEGTGHVPITCAQDSPINESTNRIKRRHSPRPSVTGMPVGGANSVMTWSTRIVMMVPAALEFGSVLIEPAEHESAMHLMRIVSGTLLDDGGEHLDNSEVL